MQTIKTNFEILKKNIQTILSRCTRPITKKSINIFINENNTSLEKNHNRQTFTFDSILKDLKNMKKYIEDNNFKNREKDMYNSINKYLNIWKRINETLLIFTDKQEKNKNSEINAFLSNEVKGYTSSHTSSNNEEG